MHMYVHTQYTHTHARHKPSAQKGIGREKTRKIQTHAYIEAVKHEEKYLRIPNKVLVAILIATILTSS